MFRKEQSEPEQSALLCQYPRDIKEEFEFKQNKKNVKQRKKERTKERKERKKERKIGR